MLHRSETAIKDIHGHLESTRSNTRSFGVSINAIEFDDLVDLYRKTGFLYPAKAVRIDPNIDLIRENWYKMLRGGELLLYVLTAGDRVSGRASLVVWRTSSRGMMVQHLVSESNPWASRAVMLAASAGSIANGIDESIQNWFRPDNRFPWRVFSSMVQTVGTENSSVLPYSFHSFPRASNLSGSSEYRVLPYTVDHNEAFCALAESSRSKVYVTADELRGDATCEKVNSLYECVGLKKRRRIWLVFRRQSDLPVGAIVANRAPLGLNFSFLENRCELLLEPTVKDEAASNTIALLLQKASEAYEDFELPEIPVVIAPGYSDTLRLLGGTFLRNYCQGIWLKNGHPKFYAHVDRFYSKLISRQEKRRKKLSEALN